VDDPPGLMFTLNLDFATDALRLRGTVRADGLGTVVPAEDVCLYLHQLALKTLLSLAWP